MEIYQYVALALALLACAAVITVVVRRRSESLQRSMQPTLRQSRQKVKAERVMDYLVGHNIDHELFTSRFELYRAEFGILVANNQQISGLLVEHLHSLSDMIEFQINDDIEHMPTLSPDVRDVINARHLAWHRMQAEITKMLGG